MSKPVLTSGSVENIFRACLSAHTEGAVIIEGITRTFAFSPAAVGDHRAEIRRMLAELPDQYRKSGGGGWSFLNACNDRHGAQWTGLHQRMEELFMLGIASGLVAELLPRDMRDVLPGGMPYYVIDL